MSISEEADVSTSTANNPGSMPLLSTPPPRDFNKDPHPPAPTPPGPPPTEE